jgi:hypothetical protein
LASGPTIRYGSFLVGDAPAITYIDLILPDGGRIHYTRTSPGFGAPGAAFEHTSSPSDYLNSRLFWNGNGWTIHLQDGSEYIYPECPPSLQKACTMSSYRDARGNVLRMRHDRRLNLTHVEGPGGAAIDLEYDAARSDSSLPAARTATASSTVTTRAAVSSTSTGADGYQARYSYDDRDQC